MSRYLSVSTIVAVVTVINLIILWCTNFYTPSHTTGSARSSASEHEASDLIRDVYNSSLGFEKILVLGLPERSDHRDMMDLSAALSGMEIEFVAGVRGDDIPDNALPGGRDMRSRLGSALGAWRGHVNAIRSIVHQNLSSALILEDDSDWDVRIKDQLYDYALATNALIQPMSGYTARYADPTWISPKTSTEAPDMDFESLRATTPPQHSPYGDDWDMLWLGHCGMGFIANEETGPKGRVIHTPDPTVPEKHHLHDWNGIDNFSSIQSYPQHTRAVFSTHGGVCALAYALSQQGARKLLYFAGIAEADQAIDVKLGHFCEHGNRCLGVLPPLFDHHRPVGLQKAESEISDHGDGYNAEANTYNIRRPVKLNWNALMEGRGEFTEQFPDSK